MNARALFTVLERVVDAAAEHGAHGEPDHEVGDLQEIARELWALMTNKQRAEFARERIDFVAQWCGASEIPSW